MEYCKSCATLLLREWKGWPLRNPIPMLPQRGDGGCDVCGSLEPGIPSKDIQWLNYHEPYNTGLPDYWLLVYEQKTKWGRPYYSEIECRRCHGRAVLSEHGDARRESYRYKINCPKCGLLSPQPRSDGWRPEFKR